MIANFKKRLDRLLFNSISLTQVPTGCSKGICLVNTAVKDSVPVPIQIPNLPVRNTNVRGYRLRSSRLQSGSSRVLQRNMPCQHRCQRLRSVVVQIPDAILRRHRSWSRSRLRSSRLQSVSSRVLRNNLLCQCRCPRLRFRSSPDTTCYPCDSYVGFIVSIPVT